VKNVFVLLLGIVLTLTVIVGSQDAYAGAPPPPDCGAGIANLANNEIYVVDESGDLHKIVTSGVDKADNCKVGTIKDKDNQSTIIACGDIALHPTNGKLYCVGLSKLWIINRSDPTMTEEVGPTKVGGVSISLNALEFDHGGALYASRFNLATSFYDVSTVSGGLILRDNLNIGRSSGDLIYDLVSADMFITIRGCTHVDCVDAGNDALYLIDLGTNTASFVADTLHPRVFAGDLLTSGNLCFVTNLGIMFQTDLDGNVIGGIAGDVEVRDDNDELILANGGTSNQLLLGGLKGLLDTTSSLFASVQTAIFWITSSMVVGVGLTALMFTNKNQEKIPQKH